MGTLLTSGKIFSQLEVLWSLSYCGPKITRPALVVETCMNDLALDMRQSLAIWTQSCTHSFGEYQVLHHRAPNPV